MKTAAGFVYDNPAVIELSNGTQVPGTENVRWSGGDNVSRRSGSSRRSVRDICRNCASPLNSVAFFLLVLSTTLCTISIFSPTWIYYPRRFPTADVERLIIEYPFRHASWRGLWAVCYTLPDLNPKVVERQLPDVCVWFGQREGAWETIPSWWDAAEALFATGMILLVLALMAETAFACCHCGLQRAWVPTLVASLTLTAGVMCTASLAVFGDTSFQEGELTPEPSGQEGRLDWAFHVGVGGAAGTLFTSILFYLDAVRLVRKNDGSCR